MANQLSKSLSFIVGTFQANPLVNTIAFRDDDVLDVEKENIYPLVNILLLPSPGPASDLREFRLAFAVLNQRDDTKTETPSKLLTDTNYIDNIGITDSIANDFIMEIMKDHNELDLDIVEGSISDFVPVKKYDERNCLDGVTFECTFSTHQNSI